MSYYIKQYAAAIVWRVHLVEADTENEAREASCEKHNYLGFYDDNNVAFDPKLFGPFETREEAEESPHAWVEDI